MAEKEIVIIGGGIIGCTSAYYMTRHPSASSTKITLIEASKSGPAQGASGKAGGLVARWAYPTEIVDVSFDEHVKLAEEHNGKDRWGWRFVRCANWEGLGEVVTTDVSESSKSLEKTRGLSGGRMHKAKKKRLPKDLLWVKEELTDAYSPMAKEGETAQVHPYQFTRSMFQLAQERGLGYINGRAVSVRVDDGKVTGVEYIEQETRQTKKLPATHVVVAAGAWSPQLVHGLPISAIRAHSITVRPRQGATIAPYVLFTEIRDPESGTSCSPEIYARPDNEVYACGPGDECPLPSCLTTWWWMNGLAT
jgi:glycine/D-amino acid oxidase-like deaminating enzyme